MNPMFHDCDQTRIQKWLAVSRKIHFHASHSPKIVQKLHPDIRLQKTALSVFGVLLITAVNTIMVATVSGPHLNT